MFILTVLWDNRDPQTFGPFESESAAQEVWEKKKEAFTEWEWNHFEDHAICVLNSPR
jgi:hypothetical protein